MDFTKYHGLGNDFIFVEDFGGVLVGNGEVLAKSLCDRHFGIGADGLVFITTDQASGLFEMRIFNSDGSEAAMCGNAIRCLADYLIRGDLVQGPRVQVKTASGIREIVHSAGLFTVDMGEPDFSFNQGKPVELEFKDRSWLVYPITVGNPHGVVFVEDVAALDLGGWGPALAQAEIWPDGANIEFTQISGPGRLLVRVWERGAGPTLACGTGATAAAAVTLRRGLLKGPVQVTLPGGELGIEWAVDRHLYMTGPATRVFSGIISLRTEKESGDE